MVEIAIVAVLFFTLLLGIIEFGRAWMISNMITHAARDGARAAAVAQNRGAGGTISDTSSIVTHVKDAIGSVTSANLDVAVTQTTVNGSIPVVQVRVSGTVPFVFNLPGIGTSFAVDRTVTFRDEVS